LPGSAPCERSRRPGCPAALEGDHERLLHHLLGEVELAENADQGRDRPTRFLAEQAADDLVRRL
jgi:hypothetical protein